MGVFSLRVCWFMSAVNEGAKLRQSTAQVIRTTRTATVPGRHPNAIWRSLFLIRLTTHSGPLRLIPDPADFEPARSGCSTFAH